MNTQLKTVLALATIALTFHSNAATQDSIQLKDGRFVLDQRMTRDKDGVTVHFKNGDVRLPDRLIHSTTALSVDGSKRKVSAKDQVHIDKGRVYFNGRWIAKKTEKKVRARMRKRRAEAIATAKKHRKWVNRHITKTRNFQFEYTIDPEVMKEFSDMMENYYKVFMKEWKIRKPKKMGRLKICFYHDAEYFHQVSGAPRGALGYYKFVAPRELNFFYDRMDEELTYDVMFHEVNHYLTNLIDLNFRHPLWMNEGLAEYYGASEWDAKKKKMTIGQLQEGRLAVLQDVTGLNRVGKKGTTSTEDSKSNWMGLEQMIRETEHGIQAIHYAWAWSFMHFMFHGENKKYASKFRKLFVGFARDSKITRTLPDGRGSRTVAPDEQIATIKRYLGVKDLKSIERKWHEYIRGLKATGSRGKMSAGRFAMNADMPIKAQRLFKESLAAGNENPLCYYYLGQALYQKGKYSEAATTFTKLIELDPLNGMAYIHLARCKDKLDANEKEVRRLRRLALEVDPDNYSVLLEMEDEDYETADGK